MMPQLSIVICTYNRAALLGKALHSLTTQTLSVTQFEIIVVDNNSHDDTEAVCATFAEQHPELSFRCVLETKQGLSHARNGGFAAAQAEYVTYLDDDAIAAPDFAEKIVGAFQTVQPTPLVVGGPIHPWYDHEPPRWFVDEFEMRSWGDTAGFPQVKHIPYGFSGSNISFPKTLLARYGGFSAQFGMSGAQIKVGEESDLCYRIWQGEGSWPNRIFWYSPDIVVQHLATRKNTQIAYRLRRVRASGLANAAIERRTPTLLLRTVLELGRDALFLPFRTLLGGGHLITNFVKAAQKVSYRWGFLTGLLRRVQT